LEKLQELGQALVDWIRPRIRPMLSRLGEFIAAAARWFMSDGLPMLVDKLIKLGDALIAWIKPNIRPMLEKLGELLIAIGEWTITQAIPALIENGLKLAGALIGWAADIAPDLIKGLGQMLVDLGSWVLTRGIPGLLGAGSDLGKALLDGLVNGIKGLVSAAGGLASDIADAVFRAIKSVINNLAIDPLNFGIGKAVDLLDIGLGPFINFDDQKYYDLIPRLATGGIVTSPTLALIGEAGPEAVIPLDQTGAMGAMYVTVNMPVGSSGDDVVRALKTYTRRRGGLPMQTLSKVR
jgi:hypothetical protein